jgi:hypothetical protein
LPTSGGRSVGIVRLRNKGHGFFFFLVFITSWKFLYGLSHEALSLPLGTVATDEILGISKQQNINFAAYLKEHIFILFIGYLRGPIHIGDKCSHL